MSDKTKSAMSETNVANVAVANECEALIVVISNTRCDKKYRIMLCQAMTTSRSSRTP